MIIEASALAAAKPCVDCMAGIPSAQQAPRRAPIIFQIRRLSRESNISGAAIQQRPMLSECSRLKVMIRPEIRGCPGQCDSGKKRRAGDAATVATETLVAADGAGEGIACRLRGTGSCRLRVNGHADRGPRRSGARSIGPLLERIITQAEQDHVLVCRRRDGAALGGSHTREGVAVDVLVLGADLHCAVRGLDGPPPGADRPLHDVGSDRAARAEFHLAAGQVDVRIAVSGGSRE